MPLDALLRAALDAAVAPGFELLGSPVTPLEVAAFVLSLWMVGCNLRVNPLGWPLAIVSSLLYGWLFLHSRLYGEATLQLLFVALAGWGWWQWLRGTTADGAALRVRWLGARGRWTLVAVLALAWPATGAFLRRYTDTDVPWWDAFPTAASVIGQWLLGRKHVETWIVWLVVNVVSVLLFAYKGLWLTVLLYAVFVALSVQGLAAWRRIAREQAA